MRRRDFLKGLLAGTVASVLGVAPKQVGDSVEATRRNGAPSWRFTDKQIAEVAEAWWLSQPQGILIKSTQAHSSAVTATCAFLRAHGYRG